MQKTVENHMKFRFGLDDKETILNFGKDIYPTLPKAKLKYAFKKCSTVVTIKHQQDRREMNYIYL